MPAPAVSVTDFSPPQAVPFAKVRADRRAALRHALKIVRAGADGSGWQRERPL
jgi:hypothetical protein